MKGNSFYHSVKNSVESTSNVYKGRGPVKV